MKNCNLLFILCLFFIFFNVRAQEQYPREVKIYSPNNSGNPGTVFPPTIITSPIPFSSTDYYIYPSSFSQSEMTIALSLLNPNKLLVGANVANPAGTDFWQGYYYSTNSGIGWAGNEILPGTSNRTTDPAVAFDLSGNAYFHYIEQGKLFVQKSTDGGITWQSPVIISSSLTSDKGHIAIDNTAGPFNNNIYIAYTDLNSEIGVNINFARSTNGGDSFEAPIDISNVINTYDAIGVNLAVGSNGEVYAVWAIGDDANLDSEGIGFNKSTDGGETWQTPPVRIFNIDGSRAYWQNKNPLLEDAPIRMNDFPCIAVDRSGGDWDGTIYIVFGSKGQSPDRADIHFSKSTNGGLNWTTPERINHDITSTDQWNTWITVDPYGLINVVFYDSRNDPNNQLTEVWVAQSVDGGETFTNFRVSDIAFIPYPIVGGFIAGGYMGDYIGIASSIGKAYSCWMDNRNAGIYQAYVDILDTYQADLLTLANQNNSLDQFAIAHNNGRKLVKDNTGNYHLVFSSGGEIFYHKTIDGGTSWLPANRLSDENGNNDYPSITESNGRLYVTWQRNTSSNNYDIYFAESSNGGSSWDNNYILSSENVSYDPHPTIQSSSNHTILAFRYNGGIKSLYTLHANPTPGNWITRTIGFSNSTSPTLTIAISGSTTYFPLAIANSSTNHIYYYYFNTTTQNWTSLPNNLSLIVPGGGSHLTPSISNIPGNSKLHIAWKKLIGSGSSAYDHLIIHRRSINYFSWPNEYFQTYYEGQEAPSISGLATNKVELVFQMPQQFGSSCYKMHFNGSQWNAPTSISTYGRYPSLSMGNTSAKYIWTDGQVSPYTVMLSSETLSKDDVINPLDYYTRSLTLMDSTGSYLQVKIHSIGFEFINGTRQKLDFNIAGLDSFDMTVQNCWDSLATSFLSVVPQNARKLLFDVSVSGEGINNLIGNTSSLPVSMKLNNSQNLTLRTIQNNFAVINGSIPETRRTFSISLTGLGITPGVTQIRANLNLPGLNLGGGVFASLGHIFDYTNLSSGSNKNDLANINEIQVPKELTIQNYPNPFNPSTTISFSIPEKSFVTLKVYDMLGREIANLVNEELEAGSFEKTFEASTLSSGVYIYRITAVKDGKILFNESKQMLMIK